MTDENDNRTKMITIFNEIPISTALIIKKKNKNLHPTLTNTRK